MVTFPTTTILVWLNVCLQRRVQITPPSATNASACLWCKCMASWVLQYWWPQAQICCSVEQTGKSEWKKSSCIDVGGIYYRLVKMGEDSVARRSIQHLFSPLEEAECFLKRVMRKIPGSSALADFNSGGLLYLTFLQKWQILSLYRLHAAAAVSTLKVSNLQIVPAKTLLNLSKTDNSSSILHYAVWL